MRERSSSARASGCEALVVNSGAWARTARITGRWNDPRQTRAAAAACRTTSATVQASSGLSSFNSTMNRASGNAWSTSASGTMPARGVGYPTSGGGT